MLWFILLIILVILGGAGYYFTRVLIYPQTTPFDKTRAQAIEWGYLDELVYSSWAMEELIVRSPHGYDIAAVYHPVEGSKRTVVLTHGIYFSRFGGVKYAPLFYKRGFNVLVYDLRNHGHSGGKNTSYGYYEKDDLKALVDWAFTRLGPGGIVGTMGESLGAATSLQHAAIDPRIAFVVSDSAFSDVSELVAYRLYEDYHLPRFPMVPLGNLFTRLVAGWWFRQASPIRCVGQIETPIYFIHGLNDTFILPKMGEELYQAKQHGIRKLYLAPNAGHVEAMQKNPAEYDAKLGEFLTEIGLT